MALRALLLLAAGSLRRPAPSGGDRLGRPRARGPPLAPSNSELTRQQSLEMGIVRGLGPRCADDLAGQQF